MGVREANAEESRPEARSGLQDRVETSRAGRWVISALVAFVVFAVAVSSFPRSELRRVALPIVRPVLGTLGLNQSWGMFAPNPPRRSTELLVRIHYDDGTAGHWSPPRGEPLIGAYRGYHWRKWAAAVITDRSRELWEPAAQWVARNHDHGGRRPSRIELVRRWRQLAPPGSGEAPRPWQQRVFYVLELGSGRQA